MYTTGHFSKRALHFNAVLRSAVPMAPSPTDISCALQSIPEKREFLRKAFGDLEEQRALITRCEGGWKDIDGHLSEIYDALEKRYAEIVDKEAKFEAKMAESQAALDKRENVIESREQASLARVQEQKDAAIAAIREQKRKWIEERKLLQSQSPAKPDPDSAGSKPKQKDSKVVLKDESGIPKTSGREKDGVIVKKKDAIQKDEDATVAKESTKENTSMKNKQKEDAKSKLKEGKNNLSTSPQKKIENVKPDDVVGPAEGSISKPEEENEKKEKKLGTEIATDSKQELAEEQVEEADGEPGSEEENAHDLEGQPEAMVIGDEDGNKSGDEDGSDEHEKEDSHKKDESSQSAAKVRPELKDLCEKMDGPGLCSFLTSQKKHVKYIRKELPIAMKSASAPAQLVLQALKECYSSGSSAEGVQGKNRRSCITLLESLAVFFEEQEKAGNGVSQEIKEEAKKVAESWKSKLNSKESDQSALLDVHSFFQLIATFGLTSNFKEEELCDLVVPICTRKDIPELWRKLGLAHKASGVVDRLIKAGRQLEAITYIEEYGLGEKFKPATLLKSYLKDIRKGHAFKSGPEDKDELHMKELNAAKAVLKCVEQYKLEADYPTEGLQKRIAQLEKVSTEKKRSSDTNMGASKKARANGPGGGPQSGPFRSSDRVGGRGMGGHGFGLPYGRGGRGGYPYSAGGPGYASNYSHGNYHYGGGPPPYQGPYMR